MNNPAAVTDPSGMGICPFGDPCGSTLGFGPGTSRCINIDGGGACAFLLGSSFEWMLKVVGVFSCERGDCGYYGGAIFGISNTANYRFLQDQSNALKSCVQKIFNVNIY